MPGHRVRPPATSGANCASALCRARPRDRWSLRPQAAEDRRELPIGSSLAIGSSPTSATTATTAHPPSGKCQGPSVGNDRRIPSCFVEGIRLAIGVYVLGVEQHSVDVFLQACASDSAAGSECSLSTSWIRFAQSKVSALNFGIAAVLSGDPGAPESVKDIRSRRLFFHKRPDRLDREPYRRHRRRVLAALPSESRLAAEARGREQVR